MKINCFNYITKNSVNYILHRMEKGNGKQLKNSKYFSLPFIALYDCIGGQWHGLGQ